MVTDYEILKLKPIYKLLSGLTFAILSAGLSGQEIKMTEFHDAPLDISARENPVLDANGDPCSLIKARCGLKNLKFGSDLGVRKIVGKEGESWIWVPVGTSKLTVSINDSLSFTTELPQSTEGYKVYIVVFSVIVPDKIEYRDIPKFSFESKPSGAKLFINDVYYGITPISVSYLSDSLRIRIEKKRFKTILGETDSLKENQSFSYKLTKDPSATRFFISASLDPLDYEIMNPGITFGWLGKWGFYFLARPGFINVDADYNLTDPVTNTSDLYEKNFVDHRFFMKKTEYFVGMTHRLYKESFVSLGIGYVYHNYIQKLTLNSASPVPGKYSYADFTNNDIGGTGFDLGLFIRFRNRLLLNIQSTVVLLENESNSWLSSYYRKSYLDGPDFKIGIGYSF